MSLGILTLGRLCTGTSTYTIRGSMEAPSPIRTIMNTSSRIDMDGSDNRYLFGQSSLYPWGLTGRVLYLYSKIYMTDI